MKEPRVVLMLFLPLGAQASEEVYVQLVAVHDPAVLELFEKETGIKVKYSTFESNEALFAKLKTEEDGYDVAFPSTYFVERMRRLGMLAARPQQTAEHEEPEPGSSQQAV